MANCPMCQAEVPAGSRWCAVCHSNVVNPSVGKLASPGKRLGAYVLDTTIQIIVGIIFIFFGIEGLGMAMGGQQAGGTIGILIALLLVVIYIVWDLYHFVHGTTPGKRALGMYVVREDGTRAGFWTMLFRESIGKWVSGLLFGLGYLWILLDKDRQAWHDKLASTFVVEQRARDRLTRSP